MIDQDNLEKDGKATSRNETWQHIGQPPWSTHEYSMPSIVFPCFPSLRKTFCHLEKRCFHNYLGVRDISWGAAQTLQQWEIITISRRGLWLTFTIHCYMFGMCHLLHRKGVPSLLCLVCPGLLSFVFSLYISRHPTMLLSMAKAASDCTNEQSRKIHCYSHEAASSSSSSIAILNLSGWYPVDQSHSTDACDRLEIGNPLLQLKSQDIRVKHHAGAVGAESTSWVIIALASSLEGGNTPRPRASK